MPTQKRQTTRHQGVSVHQAKDGTRVFYIRFRRGTKQIEERAGSDAQGWSASKAARLRAERIAGKSLPNTERRAAERAEKQARRWTLKALFDEYVQHRANSGKPYKSRRFDEHRFRKYFAPIQEFRPDEINPLHFERWRRTFADKSHQTQRHLVTLLIRIVRHGTEHRLCKPLDFRPRSPVVKNETTEQLTDEELAALLEAAEETSPHGGDLLTFVLLTGVRRAEALKLTFADVDFARSIALLRDTKAGCDQTLPLSKAALELVKKRRKHGTAEVFTCADGAPWSDPRLRGLFRALRRRCDWLPSKFRILHGLRHVHGTRLVQSGATFAEVSAALRHSDLKVTQRYLHTAEEQVRAAAERLAASLPAVKGG